MGEADGEAVHAGGAGGVDADEHGGGAADSPAN